MAQWINDQADKAPLLQMAELGDAWRIAPKPTRARA
jgi:hypothetical protein